MLPASLINEVQLTASKTKGNETLIQDFYVYHIKCFFI